MKTSTLWIVAVAGSLFLGFAVGYRNAERSRAHAQDRQCWPEMERVHTSMEDLQRVRVGIEHSEHLLEDIKTALTKRGGK